MKQSIGLKVKCGVFFIYRYHINKIEYRIENNVGFFLFIKKFECFENLLAKIEKVNFYLKIGIKFQERQWECVNIQNIWQTITEKCFKTAHTNLVAKLVKSCRKLLAKVEKVNSYLKIGRKFQVR